MTIFCGVTGNPCGTDTYLKGYECKCPNCETFNENRDTNTHTNLESSACHELAPAEEIKGIKPPYCVQVHSIRKRATDIDGMCAKYIIDGLIKAGIFPDDDQRFIQEVRFTQEKGSEEKTIIEIVGL